MRSTVLLSSLIGFAAATESLVVSLGSSYSAGIGLAKPIGEILAEKLETTYGQTFNFSNIAVSGSLLGDVTNNQARKLAGTKPTVVYLVSGGNDLNYVACLSNPQNAVCQNLISRQEYTSRYQAALDAIVKNLDNDKTIPIYVVEYLQAIDAASNCGSSNTDCPFTSSELTEVTGIYDDVTEGTVEALNAWKAIGSNSEYRVTFIPMRQYSAGHRVGSTAPWINGATVPTGAGGILWHPNNAGAEAVAQYIYEDLVNSSASNVPEC